MKLLIGPVDIGGVVLTPPHHSTTLQSLSLLEVVIAQGVQIDAFASNRIYDASGVAVINVC